MAPVCMGRLCLRAKVFNDRYCNIKQYKQYLAESHRLQSTEMEAKNVLIYSTSLNLLVTHDSTHCQQQVKLQQSQVQEVSNEKLSKVNVKKLLGRGI